MDLRREQGSPQDGSSDVGKRAEAEVKDKEEEGDGQKGQVSVGRQEAAAPPHRQGRPRTVKPEDRDGGRGTVGTEQMYLVPDSLPPLCSQPSGAHDPK